jgi:hypothetical protein
MHTILVSKKASQDHNVNYKNYHVDETDHFFLRGWLQDSQQNAPKLCKERGFKDNDIQGVVLEQRWYQNLICSFYGLYCPRKTYVYCEEVKE